MFISLLVRLPFSKPSSLLLKRCATCNKINIFGIWNAYFIMFFFYVLKYDSGLNALLLLLCVMRLTIARCNQTLCAPELKTRSVEYSFFLLADAMSTFMANNWSVCSIFFLLVNSFVGRKEINNFFLLVKCSYFFSLCAVRSWRFNYWDRGAVSIRVISQNPLYGLWMLSWLCNIVYRFSIVWNCYRFGTVWFKQKNGF